MLNVVVFALVFALVQLVVGFAVMRVCMTEWFVRKYMRFMKKYMNVLAELVEEEEEV